MRESADFELVGMVEAAEAVREPFAKLGAQFISRDELFARAEVVVVDSAVADHARDAKLALTAGKHVHVEKPLAAAVRDGTPLSVTLEQELQIQTALLRASEML